MSNFTVTFTPGYVWQDGELWTAEKANLAANPTINVTGNPGSIVLGAGSVGIANMQAGMFTADVTGRAPFATGWLNLNLVGTRIFTADASGRAPWANGWLTVPLVATGTFTATPAGRAPFASGMVNAGMVQPDAYWYAVGGGTGSAYTATFSPLLTSYVNNSGVQVYTSYWDGLRVMFKAPATCAAAATLNVDVLGIKPIYRPDGVAVRAGDILSGSLVDVVYSSTLNSGGGAFQLMEVAPPLAWYRAGTFSFTDGLVVSFSSATPNATTSYMVLLTAMSATGGSNYAQSAYVLNLTSTGFTVKGYGGGLSAGITFAYLVVPPA